MSVGDVSLGGLVGSVGLLGGSLGSVEVGPLGGDDSVGRGGGGGPVGVLLGRSVSSVGPGVSATPLVSAVLDGGSAGGGGGGGSTCGREFEPGMLLDEDVGLMTTSRPAPSLESEPATTAAAVVAKIVATARPDAASTTKRFGPVSRSCSI